MKKDAKRRNFAVFSPRYFENFIVNEKCNPWIDTIRTFFFNIRALFSIFQKMAGDNSSPYPRSLCSCISHGYQTIRYALWNQNKIWIFTLFYVFFICQLNAKLNIIGPNFISVMIKKILLYNAYQDF